MDTAAEFHKLAAWYERCARFMQMPQDREMRLRYADHFRRMAEARAPVPASEDGALQLA